MRVARLALPVLLLVTLLFALIDFGLRKLHFLEKWGSDWDPLKLPPSDRQAKQVRRSSSIAGIIIQSLFILWWWNHGSIPYLVVTNAGAHMHFAPVLTMLYVPVLVIAFLNLAQHWLNFVEPDWRWLPPTTGLVTSLVALFVLYPLLVTSPLISISEPNSLPLNANEAAQIQKVLAMSVTWLWIGIMVVGAISPGGWLGSRDKRCRTICPERQRTAWPTSECAADDKASHKVDKSSRAAPGSTCTRATIASGAQANSENATSRERPVAT